MKDKEIWRDISGYNGFYQVSTFGKVRSLDREIICSNKFSYIKKGIIKKPSSGSNPYLGVNLYKNGICRRYSVHRLVLITFVGERLGFQVNHKNGIKTDNRIENLEWVTNQENVKHSIKNGLRDFKKGKNPLARRIKDLRTGEIFGTMKELADSRNISYECLSRFLKKDPNDIPKKYKDTLFLDKDEKIYKIINGKLVRNE